MAHQSKRNNQLNLPQKGLVDYYVYVTM